MQTKRQLKADLASAIRRIQELEGEVRRQHKQIDVLTILSETSNLNEKLSHLGKKADELAPEPANNRPHRQPLPGRP